MTAAGGRAFTTMIAVGCLSVMLYGCAEVPQRKEGSFKKAGPPEKKAVMPERKAALLEKKASLPEKKAVMPERKASIGDRKILLPEKRTPVVEKKEGIPERFLKEAALPGKDAQMAAAIEISPRNRNHDAIIKTEDPGHEKPQEVDLRLMNDSPSEALSFYRVDGPLQPRSWEPYYNAGLLYMKLNDREKAKNAFDAALKHNAPASKVYNALGTLYSSAGKQSNAVEFYNGALMIEKSSYTMVNLANTYLGMGRSKDAVKLYRDAEAIDPSNPVVHYNMGLIFYNDGDYERALYRFDAAVGYGRKDFHTLFIRAQTMLKLRKYEEALRAFEELKAGYPQDPRSYKNLGIIYEIYFDDMEKALSNYTDYISRGGREAKEAEAWADVIKAMLAAEEKKEENKNEK
ncbi:MAG: tetratricopeptide repeat protein [Deltaproteobacteria bacterium]|nr:tetratricopeptide repeat protein [Deltaproteobacteria bacterium]